LGFAAAQNAVKESRPVFSITECRERGREISVRWKLFYPLPISLPQTPILPWRVCFRVWQIGRGTPGVTARSGLVGRQPGWGGGGEEPYSHFILSLASYLSSVAN
jgi:hypothetical protein